MSSSRGSTSSDSGSEKCLKFITKMAIRYKRKYQTAKTRIKSAHSVVNSALAALKEIRNITALHESHTASSDSLSAEEKEQKQQMQISSRSESLTQFLQKRSPQDLRIPKELGGIPTSNKKVPLSSQINMIKTSDYLQDHRESVSPAHLKPSVVGSQHMMMSESTTEVTKHPGNKHKETQTECSPVNSPGLRQFSPRCQKCEEYKVQLQAFQTSQPTTLPDGRNIQQEYEKLKAELTDVYAAINLYLGPVRDIIHNPRVKKGTDSKSSANSQANKVQNFIRFKESLELNNPKLSAEFLSLNELSDVIPPPNTPSSPSRSRFGKIASFQLQTLEIKPTVKAFKSDPLTMKDKQIQCERQHSPQSGTSHRESSQNHKSTLSVEKGRAISNRSKMKEEQIRRSNSAGLKPGALSVHKRTHPMPGPDSIYAGIAHIPKRSLRSGKKITETAGEFEYLQLPHLSPPRRAHSPDQDSQVNSTSTEPPLLELLGGDVEYCHCIKPHTNDKPKLVMAAIPIKQTSGNMKKRGRPRKYLRPENMQSTTLEKTVGKLICMTCGKLVNKTLQNEPEESRRGESHLHSEVQEVSGATVDMDGSSQQGEGDTQSDDGSKCPQCLRSYHTTYRVVEDLQEPKDPPMEG